MHEDPVPAIYETDGQITTKKSVLLFREVIAVYCRNITECSGRRHAVTSVLYATPISFHSSLWWARTQNHTAPHFGTVQTVGTQHCALQHYGKHTLRHHFVTRSLERGAHVERLQPQSGHHEVRQKFSA